MTRTIIKTVDAPDAIGTYSQAVKVGKTVYISGQIPLDPKTMEIATGGTKEHINQVINNLQAIAKASGGSLKNIVKLNVFLTDLNDFALVNEVMANHFTEPYPARAAIGVAQLPKGVSIEMDAILYLDD